MSVITFGGFLRRKRRQPEPLTCPVTGADCNYSPLCKARLAKVERGDKFLSADFLEEFPDESAIIEEVANIIDEQFCAELSIGALWNIARDETQHPAKRKQAERMAGDLIEVRANFAGWEQPPEV